MAATTAMLSGAMEFVATITVPDSRTVFAAATVPRGIQRRAIRIVIVSIAVAVIVGSSAVGRSLYGGRTLYVAR